MINTSHYVDTLHNLSESIGDKITLNQALEIADKMEEATQKVLDKGIEGDSYEMTEYEDILTEVLGK
jgi:hypothetical protein